MKSTRRILALLILAVPAVLFSVAGAKPPAHSYLVLVGTYTHKTASKGIYAFSYDAETGKLTPKGVAAETPDPSFVAIHPNGKYAYAVNETGKQSTVSAFALDAQTGKLTLLNQLPALGEDPATSPSTEPASSSSSPTTLPVTLRFFPSLPTASSANIPRCSRTPEHPVRIRSDQEGPHAHWIEGLRAQPLRVRRRPGPRPCPDLQVRRRQGHADSQSRTSRRP